VAEGLASVPGRTFGNAKKWPLTLITKQIRENARSPGTKNVPITGAIIGVAVLIIVNEIARCKNTETKRGVWEILQKWTRQNHFPLLNQGLIT